MYNMTKTALAHNTQLYSTNNKLPQAMTIKASIMIKLHEIGGGWLHHP